MPIVYHKYLYCLKDYIKCQKEVLDENKDVFNNFFNEWKGKDIEQKHILSLERDQYEWSQIIKKMNLPLFFNDISIDTDSIGLLKDLNKGIRFELVEYYLRKNLELKLKSNISPKKIKSKIYKSLRNKRLLMEKRVFYVDDKYSKKLLENIKSN